MFVSAQVERGVFVDGTGVAGGQIRDSHGKCLFVLLKNLALAWVDDATDTGRNDVVHRGLVCVFFKIDGCDAELPARGWSLSCVQGLFVVAPFTTYKVEGGKTKNDRIAEIGEEHTHETDTCEIVDVTFT